MSYIVCAYYTRDTLYEEKARTLVASLNKFKIPYDVRAIENLGDWYKNTGYKPTFLKKMLEKHPDKSVVYVDCDAEFLRYPDLFENWSTLTYIDVGVYVFDRSCYKKSAHGFEVLSGTIFLQNNKEVYETVERWEQECKEHPHVWDQRSLEKVLDGHFNTLPGEYCKIFDRMEDITDPVIVHYQASRQVRKNKGNLK